AGALDGEEAAALEQRAPSGTGPARLALAGGRLPGTLAGGADVGPADLELLADAPGSLDQVQVDIDPDVAAGACPPAPASAAPTEEAVEDVAEHLGDAGVAEVGHRHAVQAGVAVTVVDLSFLVVAEDLVSLGDLLELLGRLAVARVAVGVMLEGELAIRLVDLVGGRLASESQDLVVIAFLCHRAGHWRHGWAPSSTGLYYECSLWRG